jgi:hypothetical protein
VPQQAAEPDLATCVRHAIAELAKIDGSITGAWRPTACTGHILQHASEEQKQKYFAQAGFRRVDSAWVFTEPNTGTRCRQRTTAVLDESGQNLILTAPLSPTANPVMSRSDCAHRRGNFTGMTASHQ